MGKEKKEAPDAKKEGEKLSPEEAAKKARTEYEEKWTSVNKKIDDFKKSPDWRLKALAAQYEGRMKKEAVDPKKMAPMLKEEEVRENIKKVVNILEKFEYEPAVRYTRRVEWDRAFLKETVQKFPQEPYFQRVLADFEKTVKQLGIPTTEAAVDQAISKLNAASSNEKFNSLYNRETYRQTLSDYLKYKVRESMKKISDFDTVDAINFRLRKAMPNLKDTFADYKKKDPDIVADEYTFTMKGLFVRITADGKAVIAGATLDAKDRNRHLASLPTEGKSLDRATEKDKKLAQQKYDEGVNFFNNDVPATALKAFKDSYDVLKSPNSHWMMVRCYMEMGLNYRALDEAQAVLHEAEVAAKKDPKYSETIAMIKKTMSELPAKIKGDERELARSKKAAKEKILTYV